MKLCGKCGGEKKLKTWASGHEWICDACRREYETRRRRRLGVRPRSVPIAEGKWGSRLMGCRPPECPLGRRLVELVRGGAALRDIASKLGVSPWLAHYYIKRLVVRDEKRRILEAASLALAENAGKASSVMTVKQLEVARMLLGGMVQADAAETLGISQAAVASRLSYARAAIAKRGDEWARMVSAGLEVVGSSRNLSRFQMKPPGACGRRKKMDERRNEVVRETELTVELSAGELNYAVSQWAAGQPEASEELKRLVAGGANVSLTFRHDGSGATLRLWREDAPKFRIGGDS